MDICPALDHAAIQQKEPAFDGRMASGGGRDDGSDRVTFLLGGARSGTTWLAKILDSHPDVLYRHEPDIALQEHDGPGLPRFCDAAQLPRHRAVARAYAQRMLDVRTLRTSGSLPVFRKSYHGALAPKARLALALALKAAEQLPGCRRVTRGIPIPDFVEWRRQPGVRVVVKSVSALARAGLLAEAMPESRFILLLRHPCGQVASKLRGIALGKFVGALNIGEGLASSVARSHGLTQERFAALTPAEQHAWDWAILNQWALEQLRRASRLKVVRYEDVCADPRRETEGLLAFAGLPWSAQTEKFVSDSSSYDGPDRYYQVFKNTPQAAERWRNELAPEAQRSILAIVRQTEAGRMFTEHEA